MTRNIRVRFSRKSRGGAAPGDADDPAVASGAESGDAFQEFDLFPEGAPILPDPSLTAAERAEAEEEASQGIPTSAASAPSPGERRVEGRFQEAMARARSRAEEALARLRAAQREARTRAIGVEAGAARERDRALALADVQAACQGIETRHLNAQTAAKELAGFRRELWSKVGDGERRGWRIVGVTKLPHLQGGVIRHDGEYRCFPSLIRGS